MKNHVIVGIHITDRVHHVAQVQSILTEYGCSIRTRLGLHEAGSDYCSPNGLLLLEMIGETKASEAMMAKLHKVEGVEVQKMIFTHP